MVLRAGGTYQQFESFNTFISKMYRLQIYTKDWLEAQPAGAPPALTNGFDDNAVTGDDVAAVDQA